MPPLSRGIYASALWRIIRGFAAGATRVWIALRPRRHVYEGTPRAERFGWFVARTGHTAPRTVVKAVWVGHGHQPQTLPAHCLSCPTDIGIQIQAHRALRAHAHFRFLNLVDHRTSLDGSATAQHCRNVARRKRARVAVSDARNWSRTSAEEPVPRSKNRCFSLYVVVFWRTGWGREGSLFGLDAIVQKGSYVLSTFQRYFSVGVQCRTRAVLSVGGGRLGCSTVVKIAFPE